MNCSEIRARLHAYVDGELMASDIAEVDGHCMECRQCAALVSAEREFRQLLRRQPRDAAPSELRAHIIRRIRRDAVFAKGRRWLPVSGVAVAAAIVAALLLPARTPPPLVADLVDKHIAYAQIERPAELASTDPAEIAAWFQSRAGMRVTVPDYSPSGIHLTGARLAEAHERRAAYLLYEKGRTLMSVFMVPVSDRDATLPGRRVSYRDHDYVAYEHKGFRTVSWADGQAVYGLVSMLDYDALLECADRLRAERARQTRL
ncbi:MAG TPA: zf-HC2 domain-containing protein [Methylomirabilota bacterium]|jgi:mycothiol system anti-sigma-R factor